VRLNEQLPVSGSGLAEHIFSASAPTTDMRWLNRNDRFVPSADLLNHLVGDSPDQTRLLMFSVAN